jgi:hypothetical protein
MSTPNEVKGSGVAAKLPDRPNLSGYQNVRAGHVLKGDLLIWDDGVFEHAKFGGESREVIGTGECPALHGATLNAPWGACRVYRRIPVAKQGLSSTGQILTSDTLDGDDDQPADTGPSLLTPGAVEAALNVLADDPATADAMKRSMAEPDKARTYDDGKAPLAYLPWAALDELAMVQSYGEKKYGSFWNYRKGMEVGRNLSCAIRHIRDYMDGQDTDKESGRSHLGHAMCRIAFVLQNLKDGTAIDDRYKK